MKFSVTVNEKDGCEVKVVPIHPVAKCNVFVRTYKNKTAKEAVVKTINEYFEGGKQMKNKPPRIIKVKYLDDTIEKMKKIAIGDWIDLRAAETYELKSGDFAMIRLGVAIQVPQGFESLLVPRSSTFKNYGIIQTNSVGVIDNSYSGNNDEWKLPVYATRDTIINKNDRICQFRIIKNQPSIIIEEVSDLENPDRGGFGSTGKN